MFMFLMMIVVAFSLGLLVGMAREMKRWTSVADEEEKYVFTDNNIYEVRTVDIVKVKG